MSRSTNNLCVSMLPDARERIDKIRARVASAGEISPSASLVVRMAIIQLEELARKDRDTLIALLQRSRTR